MSRINIDDLWLKNDGELSPSISAKRSLANAKDPFKANVPERWRITRYGKGKRWRCRWYMAGPDGVKRQKSKAFVRYSEAEEFAAAMEDDVRRGRYTNPADTQRRFGDVAELWLRTKVDIKASTFNRYRDELRCYVNPKWGDTSLGALTPQGMTDWVNELMEGTYSAILPKNREPIPLSPRSIRNIVKVVTAGVLGYAIEQRWIGENVARKAKTPKIVRKDEDMVFLTIPEVEELADTAAKIGTKVDGTLIRFLAYTGCRINEALALQVRDMRLDEGRARISRAWSESKDRHMELATPQKREAENNSDTRLHHPGNTSDVLRPGGYRLYIQIKTRGSHSGSQLAHTGMVSQCAGSGHGRDRGPAHPLSAPHLRQHSDSQRGRCEDPAIPAGPRKRH